VEEEITSGPGGSIYIAANAQMLEGITSRARGSKCGLRRVLSCGAGWENLSPEGTVGKPYNLPVSTTISTYSGRFSEVLKNRQLL